MLTFLDGYTPHDLGLGEEYAAYRNHPETDDPVQLEVIEFAAYCEKRVAAAAAPVGIGKMLIAMSVAKLTGLRTAIVAPYKGLQDQYRDKLGRHLTDIRGRQNYDCMDYQHLSCKGGASMGCRYTKGKGCSYEMQKDAAKNADVIVTNYDFWLNVNDHAGGIQRTGDDALYEGKNPIELLILDEGDEAAEKVADYLAVKVDEGEVKRWCDPRDLSDDVMGWQNWIKGMGIVEELDAEIRTAGMELAFLGRGATKKQVDDLHRLERLKQKFERIKDAADDWVCEAKIGTRYGRQWNFDVVAPGRYVEQYLFCGIPKIVIMSGTLTTKDLVQLWIKRTDYEYRQWGRIFPADKQPIYKCPPKKVNAEGKTVSIRIDKKTSAEDLRVWMVWNDEFIGERLDRKGLIITSSYEWQRYFLDHSQWAEYMESNTGNPEDATAMEVAERFFEADAPRILVGPSFGRGWDFLYEKCEYVLIPKCPFIPMYGKVVKARMERDPTYCDLITAKKIQQWDGRGKRAPDDRCETVLTDGHFDYFLYKAKNLKLAMGWWVDSVRNVTVLPKRPEKLVRGVNYGL